MKKIISFFILLFLFASLAANEFDEVAKALCKQVQTGIGVLPDMPASSEPMHQFGSFEQQLHVENSNSFILRISCSKRVEFQKPEKATFERRFFLSDFAPGSARRFEINHKLLTLSIQDELVTWHIGFRTSAELTKAAALFDRLISLSSTASFNKPSLSSIARQAGFSSLVLCPEGETLNDVVSTLCHTTHSKRLRAFLSRNSIQDKQKLLFETENRLPFFVYSLDVLDTSSFYTVDSPESITYCPYTLSSKCKQSIISDDQNSLTKILSCSTTQFIRFITPPSLHHPIAIFCTPQENTELSRLLKKRGLSATSATFSTHTPLFWQDCIPEGTPSFWLLPRSLHSDDMLRFWFETATFASLPQTLSAFVQQYPNAQPLLLQKSVYVKQGTVLAGIIKSFTLLHTLKPTVPASMKKVLKIALICHEMGACFGPRKNLGYNSIPFALMLAEKLGLKEKEQTLLELLLSSPQKTKQPPSHDSSESLKLLIDEALLAAQHKISPYEWLTVKAAFTQIVSSLSSQEPLKATIYTEPLKKYPQKTISCLTFGLRPLQGILSTRKIFSSYLWEVRDPLHRDGLKLKRLRERYEQELLANPKSQWKGQFWEWVDEKLAAKPLPGTKYLEKSERLAYEPCIKNGKLYTHNGKPLVSQETMFVFDQDQTLYVGQKKDAVHPKDLSFNHASFTSGAPVAAVGKFVTDIDGRPIVLRNVSGHYRPKIHETIVALLCLQQKGLDISKMTVEIKSGFTGKIPEMSGDRFLLLYNKDIVD